MPTCPEVLLAETAMLSLEERGAYRDILDHLWSRDGWLTDDDEKIARLLRITKNKWLKIKPALKGFFQYYDNGKFTQTALLNNYARTLERIEKNRKNGKTGGLNRMKSLNSTQATANPDANTNAPRTLGDVLGYKP